MILAVTLLREHTSRYQGYWLLRFYASTLPDNKDTGCYAVTLLHEIAKVMAVTLLHENTSRYQVYWLLYCYTVTQAVSKILAVTVTRAHSKITKILTVTLLHCLGIFAI